MPGDASTLRIDACLWMLVTQVHHPVRQCTRVTVLLSRQCCFVTRTGGPDGQNAQLPAQGCVCCRAGCTAWPAAALVCMGAPNHHKGTARHHRVPTAIHRAGRPTLLAAGTGVRVAELPAAAWWSVPAAEGFTEGAAAWDTEGDTEGAGPGSRAGSRGASATGLRTMGAGNAGLLMLGGGVRTRSCKAPSSGFGAGQLCRADDTGPESMVHARRWPAHQSGMRSHPDVGPCSECTGACLAHHARPTLREATAHSQQAWLHAALLLAEVPARPEPRCS